jgi:alpha-beta hydrolase superfamily lysophospholipase
VTAPPGDGAAAAAPSVSVLSPRGPTTAVVLVLGGGKAHSYAATAPGQLTAVRMRPFAAALHRHGRRHGLEVWTVRYRYRGWNGRDRSPVADVEWAIAEVRQRHGDVPLVLVGHSMGGRTALACGGATSIKGICVLAPWTEDRDHVEQLAGRTVLMVHGSADRVTSPHASRAFAARAAKVGARVGYISLPGEMHAMVFRWRTWHQIVAGFTLGVLGFAPMPRRVELALIAGV